MMDKKSLNPRFVVMESKQLIGQRLRMCVANPKVADLWKSFSPRVEKIKAMVGEDRFSISVYEPDYFVKFEPMKEFDKWAAVQVNDIQTAPEDMEAIQLPSGLYAVFHYIGRSTDNSIFQEIYGNWLPNSEYELDCRPHFEVLGRNFKNNDPSSEEEIWVPVKKREQKKF